MRGRALSLAGWILLTLLAALPMATLVTQALAKGWFYPDLAPADWSLEAARRVAGDPGTRDALWTGLRVSAIATVMSVVLAVPAARALALGGTRHARGWALGFVVPTALPPVALAMGLNVAVLRAGVAGSEWTVAVAHLVATLPYAVLVLTAALTRYDGAYERQAAVLGASPARVLTRVFLPLAAPAILVCAALSFVVSWSQYLLTLLPGGGGVTTVPVLVLAAAGGGNPGLTAALALLAAVPPALAILVVVRRLDALAPVPAGAR